MEIEAIEEGVISNTIIDENRDIVAAYSIIEVVILLDEQKFIPFIFLSGIYL